MRKLERHLNNDLLVRAIDDELSPYESEQVQAHIQDCEDCRRRYQEMRTVCIRLESAVNGFSPEFSAREREALAANLEAREQKTAVATPRRALRQFGWGMALAASLAVGIFLAPRTIQTGTKAPGALSPVQASETTLEVDGETFVALPYSNPDLPVNSARIVEMRVPVSSLTDAGVIFEPITSQVSTADRSVLADVLLGIDGQPLGVHVLSEE